MIYSHTFKKRLRALFVCLLSLLMLVSLCFVTSAAENSSFNTLLTLDPNEMSNADGSDENFTWDLGGNSSFTTATLADYTGKTFYIAGGQFMIYDTNKVLADYEAVSVGFDLYFDTLPNGNDALYSSSDAFKPQSVIAWLGNSYDGLRIDAEGNLYSNTTASTSLDVKLEAHTWYNIRLVFSLSVDKVELWLDGERVATAPCYHRTISDYIRIFDGSNSYKAHIKNIEIAATDDFYYCGLEKEASADSISYQTTKPAEDGSFDLRVLAGINSLEYQSFGYKVLVLTRDGVATELTGADTRAYSAVKSGSTEYSIKEHFGYDYACLATITNLDANSDFTELVIFPYTVSKAGNKLYGSPFSLAYVGELNSDGYPVLHMSDRVTDLTPTDDTYIDYSRPNTVLGSDSQFIIRNTGGYSTGGYRAAYYKFNIPAETVSELDYMTNITLKVYINSIESRSDRQKYAMNVYGVSETWEEDTLTYYTLYPSANANANARTDLLDSVAAEDYFASSYLVFDVTEYVKDHPANDDGSIDVSFCVTQPDGYSDIAVVYLASKEAGDNAPMLHFEKTLYGHAISNAKTNNIGYEPLSYAETLVTEWFDELYDKVYPTDAGGNLIYHSELGSFAPEGYGATTATGDFTNEMAWKNSSAWATEDPYIVTESDWRTDRFARTLSTLGKSKANAYLESSYASTATEYDIYGGITNAGFTGEATGFFHTEKHTDGRTYIIDPLGNPYFAVSMNDITLGETANHKSYSLEAFETEEAYFEAITASLKDMGINTAFVSDNNALLSVDNGINTVVSVSGIATYMGKLGRSQVREGVYPYNNTLNVFDPDFAKTVNAKNAKLITENGYAENPNVFAYSSDNELPAGDTILERYLTLDPSVPESSFSYHTAWTWLARRMDTLNPTLEDYVASPEKARMNSEFLAFLYTTCYHVIRDSIEAVDSNHMYIGSRAFDTCKTDEGYLRAAGYCLDVITLNLYDGLNPSAETLSNIYYYSGKPFIVTEFFAKGLDAIDANGYKLANSTGAGILVYTQEDRATYYESYVLNLLESKSCVGWSWYRFRDNDQSLYTITKNGTTYEDLRMLYVYYSLNSYPVTFMDKTGTLYALSDLYSGTNTAWSSAFTQTYKGEGIASNQNVNKGIYNSNLSSTVTVYSYNSDGTLDLATDPFSFGSESYEVQDPASETPADGTVLTSKDGTTTYTLGKAENTDGSYTVTVLTTYKGKYLSLTDSIKNISDNIMGLVNYLDNN